jgi:hypothetical protein
MRKTLLHISLAIFSSIAASVHAQTDTGGGMGGTGINEKSIPFDPAKAEKNSNSECKKESSIGLYQLKSARTEKIKEQGYVCVGQLLKTNLDEVIEVHFRSGIKIKIFEESQVHINTLEEK